MCRYMNMKITKRGILAIAVGASLLAPAVLRAEDIKIEVGDRPFYSHGARYWQGDYEMVWAPGHWDDHHHWVHGKYARGEHRRHHDEHAEHHDGDGH
jgi:hypothetical protein